MRCVISTGRRLVYHHKINSCILDLIGSINKNKLLRIVIFMLLLFVVFNINNKKSFADSYWHFAQVSCIPEFDYFVINGFRIHSYSASALDKLLYKYDDLEHQKHFKEQYNIIHPDDNEKYECKLNNVTLSYQLDTVGDYPVGQLLRIWRNNEEIVQLNIFNSIQYGMESVNFLKYSYYSMEGEQICIKGRDSKEGIGKSHKDLVNHFEPCYYIKHLNEDELPIGFKTIRKYNYRTQEMK